MICFSNLGGGFRGFMFMLGFLSFGIRFEEFDFGLRVQDVGFRVW